MNGNTNLNISDLGNVSLSLVHVLLNIILSYIMEQKITVTHGDGDVVKEIFIQQGIYQ